MGCNSEEEDYLGIAESLLEAAPEQFHNQLEKELKNLRNGGADTIGLLITIRPPPKPGKYAGRLPVMCWRRYGRRIWESPLKKNWSYPNRS